MAEVRVEGSYTELVYWFYRIALFFVGLASASVVDIEVDRLKGRLELHRVQNMVD